MTNDKRTIIVDGVFFQLNKTGIARLWKEVLLRWQEEPIGRRVVVLDRGKSLPNFARLRTISCDAFSYDNWQDDQGLMQEICEATSASLFISTYYTRPSRTPALLYVHDMIPERMGFDLTYVMWRQKHDAIRHARAFAVNSGHTLADLHELFPDTRSQPAQIIHPGVGAEFRPPSNAECQEFHARFVVPHLAGRPYFLFVGDHWPYKNSELLYRAVAALPVEVRSRIGLLLTHVELLPRFKTLSGVNVHAAWLADEDLRLAYGCAVALPYLSLYEGFGLPALEAMACGCPVICARTSALPEVVGDAALFTHPLDERELLNRMLLVQNPPYRSELRRRGIEQAKRFSWDTMASELAAWVEQFG